VGPTLDPQNENKNSTKDLILVLVDTGAICGDGEDLGGSDWLLISWDWGGECGSRVLFHLASVTHTYNPSYSGGRYQEDCGSKPA
jgi:hypothetical protein